MRTEAPVVVEGPPDGDVDAIVQDEAPGARGGPVSGTLAEVAARARGSG